jgi:hypothetical protein
MGWQDQGRQEHGRFGHGMSVGAVVGGTGDGVPATLGERIATVAHSVVAQVPRSDRRAAATFDNIALGRLQGAMTAWNKAAALSRDAFRDRFLDPRTGDATVDLLRSAASGAALAGTTADMRAAGTDLTAAIQRIGLDRWPRYLADAANRAEAASGIPAAKAVQYADDKPPGVRSDSAGDGAQAGKAQIFIDPNPYRWLDQGPVGDGECVALVKKTAGAPPTRDWRQGEKVRGNDHIIPGTLIATFDPDGRYGNHTNQTSHAALYLDQDENGMRVIDQWNKRDKNGNIIGQQPPHIRYIKFNNPTGMGIDQGENYHVVTSE